MMAQANSSSEAFPCLTMQLKRSMPQQQPFPLAELPDSHLEASSAASQVAAAIVAAVYSKQALQSAGLPCECCYGCWLTTGGRYLSPVAVQ
jgi:hypothetical protein